ncbi:MAG: Flp pilus assembly complex ATPase component TadA, partial [Deltaproteobacteria bacterium]|nr:Flp pilus assembly complex ATPase component TadA [Deltaproteobacteria bacterium]
LIGEIRDQDTMHSAITYAETGHLCLATIHASNAIETLDRVLNFFPPNNTKQLLFDLSRNLKAVICQRLVKGLGGERWPAMEVMQQSPYISELIQHGKLDEIREAIERNIEGDIVTFDQSVLSLYKEGKISKEEAISNADSKHNVTVEIRLLESGRKEKEAPPGLVDKYE